MNFSNDRPSYFESSFIEFFYYRERQTPDRVYLRQPVGDTFTDYTWGEAGQQARRLAAYLHSLNLPAQSPIGLLSKNCAHWLIADLAILISGHISVPFYPTLPAGQLNHLLDHSGCKVLFVGKIDNWNELKDAIPADVNTIAFPDYTDLPGLLSWNDILRDYPPYPHDHAPKPTDIATIIYTSGTTGIPKGVIIDFHATTQVIGASQNILCQDVTDARFFSYLPLCHVAERNLVEAIAIMTGGTIYFAESLNTFAKNLAAARPTHFIAVPRIWAKFQESILAKISQPKLKLLLGIPVIGKFVSKKIRQELGLDQAVLILNGAASLPLSLLNWFKNLGIIIQEAYGMTENLGAVSIMPKDRIKNGTVGKVIPGMAIRIDPNTGEILTKAPWNTRGYFHRQQLTKQTLTEDNWLHTGDTGTLDEDNYLTITGRIKDIFKTLKGEYVNPVSLEAAFVHPYIEQVCVTGSHLPQPVALIVLSETGKKVMPAEVEKIFSDKLESSNALVKPFEKIRKIVIVKQAWDIGNDLITPTMKIKRNRIDAFYNPQAG